MYHTLPKVESITCNRYIPRRVNNTFFSGKLSTGIDTAINFDLVKCITKNIYISKM